MDYYIYINDKSQNIYMNNEFMMKRAMRNNDEHKCPLRLRRTL